MSAPKFPNFLSHSMYVCQSQKKYSKLQQASKEGRLSTYQSRAEGRSENLEGERVWIFNRVGIACPPPSGWNLVTGKSLSEALIFESKNTQYSLNYKFNTWKCQAQAWGEHVVYRNCFWHSEQFFCTQHVLPMFCKKKSFWQRFTCTEILLPAK